MKGLSSKHIALKVDGLKDRKIYCLQARPCVFQHGNFRGWGRQWVKRETIHVYDLSLYCHHHHTDSCIKMGSD